MCDWYGESVSLREDDSWTATCVCFVHGHGRRDGALCTETCFDVSGASRLQVVVDGDSSICPVRRHRCRRSCCDCDCDCGFCFCFCFCFCFDFDGPFFHLLGGGTLYRPVSHGRDLFRECSQDLGHDCCLCCQACWNRGHSNASSCLVGLRYHRASTLRNRIDAPAFPWTSLLPGAAWSSVVSIPWLPLPAVQRYGCQCHGSSFSKTWYSAWEQTR